MSQDSKSNIQRIAAILKMFDALNTPRRTEEILSEIGIARSTGFGLLRALVGQGWLERYDHGALRLGSKARTLAFAPLEAVEPQPERKLSGVRRHAPRSRSHNWEQVGLEHDPTLVQTVNTLKFRTAPPYRFGFANASTSNAWRQAMLQSMFYASKVSKSQISELLVEDAKDNVDLQREQVDKLVAQGIDLLLISVASVTDTNLSDRLKDLSRGGLPIVAVDRRPNDRSSLVSFATASDHRIGRMSALWMAEHLSGRGRVWMLSGMEGTSPAIRRQQAALAVFSEFPNLMVENVSYSDWTESGGFETIKQLSMQAAGPPDGIWCDSGLQGVGSVKYFLSEGLKVPAHTGGDLNEMYKLCLSHKVPMAALDYPASMGARALELGLAVLKGATVPRRIEVPVQTVLPRGMETKSVKADAWAELHVAWSVEDDVILSQGPALAAAGSKEMRRVDV